MAANAVEERLRADFPAGFAIDANHAPHLTLLQRFVRLEALDAVSKAVADAMRLHPPIRIDTRTFVDALKAEPFEPLTFRAVSVSLYQLGDYGTANGKRHALHRC